MYSTVETRYTWFSSFRNVSRASGRKRRGAWRLLRKREHIYAKGKSYVTYISKSGTLSFSLENRSRSDSHTSPPPHRGRRQIKHQTPNVEELVSKTRRKKKKKKEPARLLYMATKIIDPPSIYVIVQISPREKCALPNEPPDRENNRGLGP